jgi:CheY-like chemotaxis protein
MDLPVTLRSQPERGTMFAIDLPRAITPVLAPVETKNPQTSPTEKSALAGRHIVVVEDEALVRDALAQVLAGWNCRATLSASGAQAIAALADSTAAPDLLICDYRLRDGETGLDAIELLRSEFCIDIPALLVTGDTAPERLREIVASGLPVLHKPLQPETLHAALTALLCGDASGSAIQVRESSPSPLATSTA